MTDALLHVVRAGPHVSYQDGGRPGFMRFGVAASGAMDRKALAMANLALGNPPEATTIEISLGGLTLDCVQGAMTLALIGGGVIGMHEPQFVRNLLGRPAPMNEMAVHEGTRPRTVTKSELSRAGRHTISCRGSTASSQTSSDGRKASGAACARPMSSATLTSSCSDGTEDVTREALSTRS